MRKLLLQIRATLESVATTQGSQAAAATGTGWGTLTGRFIFAGTSPTPKALVVDKDTEVCAKGGMQLVDRSLLVDPSTKGLANVVVFARKTTRVKEALPPEAPLMFDQKQCEFMAPVFAAGGPIHRCTQQRPDRPQYKYFWFQLQPAYSLRARHDL